MAPLNHKVVSREEWIEARKELLEKEKESTRANDRLTEQIRQLPWVKVDKEYIFHTVNGDKTLTELFEDKSQLFLVHFMLAPGREACQCCSFWADQYGGMLYHLPARDVSLKVVSRAPLDEIQKYRERMGWEFDWASSYNSDFNYDFNCSVRDPPAGYSGEDTGYSIFYRDGNDVYHTYSTTRRGIEPFNPVYSVLDRVPKGRDEKDLAWPMAWVKKHDEY
jgi:predicted dithiol-disulfide oxidoreductase (DUF899 family)